ncbi:MAG: hypothetical protein H0T83_09570 [Chthoniobacterales bacterium]|nr:hypothetical protein [Chthoniobacterales bacterium]
MEIGGSTERLAVASEAARFGFGICGSISETASVAGFGGGGAGAVGAGAGAVGFLAVIGAKAERVAGTDGFDAAAGSLVTGVGATGCASSGVVSSMGAAAVIGSLGLLLELRAGFAGLAAAPGRVDDLAGEALLAVLRAGALCAEVLVVVFVGI